MLAQRRLRWRLIIGFLLIVSIVAAKSDKKSFKNSQQKLAHQRLDEIQGSGQPPKPGASVDDEISAPSSGKSPNPDDEDSTPVVEGSGQPPQNIVRPPATSTKRPVTTTSTEPNELKIEDQEEDDLDDDDEEEDEDLSPIFKEDIIETTTASITTTSTSTTAAPKQVFETMTRQPPTTKSTPTFPSQVDSVNLDMLRPGLLAAISGGAVVGLLLTILLVMFIVYRMRKKDEGSYSLDEQTNHHQPAHYSYAYQKAPTKEFYA